MNAHSPLITVTSSITYAYFCWDSKNYFTCVHLLANSWNSETNPGPLVTPLTTGALLSRPPRCTGSARVYASYQYRCQALLVPVTLEMRHMCRARYHPTYHHTDESVYIGTYINIQISMLFLTSVSVSPTLQPTLRCSSPTVC